MDYPLAGYPGHREFILALAPQLETLRIASEDCGLPISLVQHIVTVGVRLRTLEMADTYAEANPAPFSLPPPTPSSVRPLDLKFFIRRRVLGGSIGLDRPVEEYLWSCFQYSAGEALDAIRAIRRVRQVALDCVLSERYPTEAGVLEKLMRKKGVEVVYERFIKRFFGSTFLN